MQELTGERGTTYLCKVCSARFRIMEDETAVCCPICRMNRFREVD